MLTNRDGGYRQVRVTCTCGARIFERTSYAYAEWAFQDNAVYAALHEAVQTHRPPEHRMRVEITTEKEAQTQEAEDSA